MSVYYNGLRKLDRGDPVVDVVEGDSRRPLTLSDGTAGFGWFNFGGPSAALAEAILTDAAGEDAADYSPDFDSRVVVHLRGSFDWEPPSRASYVERPDDIYVEQWRLPAERVRAWVSERAGSAPVPYHEMEDFPPPDEEFLRDTHVPESAEESP